MGGSCFPKDVKALIHMSKHANLEPKVLNAVEEVNNQQKHIIVEKVKEHFGENLTGLTFAIWGLAFKPQTDDMREAPSLVIINDLIQAGAKIRVYDPVAIEEAKRILGTNSINYGQSSYEIVEGSDALILVTEWHQFRNPDFDRIKHMLKSPVIFDGRNQYDPEITRQKGFTYYGIGRV